MNIKHIVPRAIAFAILLVAPAVQAQTYTDNAGNYTGNYDGKGDSTPGFGAFQVTTTATGGGAAGTFLFTATEGEANQGAPGNTPSTLDTPTTPISKQPQSFGFFAHGKSAGAGDPSVTIKRAFKVPSESAGLATAGDAFSIDFVTGFNDGGISGVSLTSASGPVGSFIYHGDGSGFIFNGTSTSHGFVTGVLHLTYTLTSSTAYSLHVTGALSYTGTGTYSSPITGFQVQAQNANLTTPDHNGYFNNLVLKCASH